MNTVGTHDTALGMGEEMSAGWSGKELLLTNQKTPQKSTLLQQYYNVYDEGALCMH